MDPKERPLVFGNRLLGVLSEPADRGDRPGLIILNAGLIHRVGPGRFSVEVARTAARSGFAAFRFDFSGLGDSEPRARPLGSVESAVADAREAMDALGAELGLRRFVLFGLCSGGVLAHHIAVADARVVGAAMLDGYVFHTVRSFTSVAWERLGPLHRLPGRTLRWAKRRLAGSPPPLVGIEGGGFIPPWPRRSRALADLQELRSRGVPLLLVFSGEWKLYRHDEQMAAVLRSVDYGNLLTEVRIPGAEHLYFTRPERDLLLNTFARWLADNWTSSPE